MIPPVYGPLTSYSTRSLPAATPYVDVGTAQEILDRVGATGRGHKQKKFLANAQGMVVLRVGFDMVALEKDDLRELLAKIG